jgi:REP element-mobilizing transposase RayT
VLADQQPTLKECSVEAQQKFYNTQTNSYLEPRMESGKLYFFTATNLNWNKLLENDQHKFIVLNSFEFMVNRGEIVVYAFVIMPNHMHLVWSISEELEPSKIQQRFMRYTAQSILENMKRNHDPLLPSIKVNAADREYQVWERNPLPVELYTEEVIWQKIDYIHNNPCTDKWLLAKYPEHYRFSSASFYILNKSEWKFLTHIQDA